MSCINQARNSPCDNRRGLVQVRSNDHFTQPLFPHRPGAPDGPKSYVGGLSVYCAGEVGGGAITMVPFGPLGPLTGLALVGTPTTWVSTASGDRDIGGGVGFEGAW